MDSNLMPPRPVPKIIKANPYDGLGLCCIGHELLPRAAGKQIAKETGMTHLRPGESWDDAYEFYLHTDPVWKKAVTCLIGGMSPHETWKTIKMMFGDTEFTEDHVWLASHQIRYWCNQ